MALTVLIVEDEQSASRLLSGIASELGLSARTTASGKEAHKQKEPPECSPSVSTACARATAAGFLPAPIS